MLSNTTGNDNTASGIFALSGNTMGGVNTAIGDFALDSNTTGSNNIAIGNGAGENLTTGSNNIEIGNSGNAPETNTIRIGVQGTQTATFIAGISGVGVASGAAVVVNSFGQLGVVPSSARYKREVRNMGDDSDRLMKLRPVSFRYKADPTSTQQYGLIAEEVAKVYPELVVNGADGKPQTVAYHLLPAMLLNELQKQARADQKRDWEQQRLVSQVEQQARQLALKDAQIAALQGQLTAVNKTNLAIDARLEALERQARRSKPERLAAAMR
jgi:hypothetical protein